MFGKRKHKEPESVGQPQPVSAVQEAPREDAALIAVIAAAVAAMMGTSANGIVIRSLRRSRPSTPQWGIAGRVQNINHEF